MKANVSVESVLIEMSDLNRVHMGLSASGLTRSYEVGRWRLLVEVLREAEAKRKEEATA